MTTDRIAENTYTGTMMNIYLRNASGSPAYPNRDAYLANAIGFASRVLPVAGARQTEAA